MSLKNPTTKNYLPPPLQSLTPREIFLYSGIPSNRLEAIAKGEFKPNESDREKLSNASVQFYNMRKVEKDSFIQRKKYRIIRCVISMTEKNELLSDSEKYLERLNALLDRHWDKVVAVVEKRLA